MHFLKSSLSTFGVEQLNFKVFFRVGGGGDEVTGVTCFGGGDTRKDEALSATLGAKAKGSLP